MASCASKKPTVNKDIILSENPKLLFLNYTITKIASGTKNINFHSKTIAEGKLKNSNNKYTKTPSVGDLKCTQLSNRLSELSTIYIKNPLNKVIEILNDSLSFEKRKIEQNRANLSLKLQLHPDTKFIEISEIVDSLNTVKQLIKTKLE
ncbi:hypothetical protein GCM10023311_09410 [Flaviramulus aquimarinus]|uniref:DUF4349 domain-containing protein n=2 Tax=Flaviramulus aquimarinus TaxID=1170456 RepID=A0ABP9EX20_9FLAO